MKRARKVSNVHGEIHSSHRKQCCKDVEYFIVDKIACHQHATAPNMN